MLGQLILVLVVLHLFSAAFEHLSHLFDGLFGCLTENYSNTYTVILCRVTKFVVGGELWLFLGSGREVYHNYPDQIG